MAIALIKYPRTPHLPYSASVTDDDRTLENDDNFKGKEVVVTIKMDGENSTIYDDGSYHARSLTSVHRDYHSWLLSYIPTIQYCIPKHCRLCGEYMYAKHSIGYNNLDSYFLAFSLWDNENNCVSWDDFEKFCNDNNISHVPVIYRGIYDANIIKGLAENVVRDGQEGLVVRLADKFHFGQFEKCIAKYVRPNHVQTDEHWSLSKIEKNELKK